jgi:hypothetical protein
MVTFGHQRDWVSEGERGRTCPVGFVPQALIYKRRVYVLARKPPVLDHHQVQIDSVFGPADRTTPRPAPRAPMTAVHRPAVERTASARSHAPAEERRKLRPRFVPRDY